MSRHTRLRVHIEKDLLGTRLTPTPRQSDPRLAKARACRRDKAVWMTDAQRRLWRELSGGADATDGVFLEPGKWDATYALSKCKPGTTVRMLKNKQGQDMLEITRKKPSK